jgi:hypothetical protein
MLPDFLSKPPTNNQALEGGLEADVDLSDLLSPSERAAFAQLATQGRLSHLLPAWRPWWERPEAAQLRVGPGGQRLIAEAAGSSRSSSSGAAVPEPPARPVPSLASLTKHRPSPLLRYQCLQLLYSYCFVLRRFNGDPGSSPLEASEQLLALAPPLEPPQQQAAADADATSSGGASSSQPAAGEAAAAAAEAAAVPLPQGAGSALRHCTLAACTRPVGGAECRPLALAVVADVAALCRLGRPSVVVALTDLGRHVAACGAAAAEARDSAAAAAAVARTAAARLRRRLKAAAQKLLFFAAWANEQLPEVWEALGAAAGAEHSRHVEEAAEQLRRGRPAAVAVAGGGGDGGGSSIGGGLPGGIAAAVRLSAGKAAGVTGGGRLVTEVATKASVVEGKRQEAATPPPAAAPAAAALTAGTAEPPAPAAQQPLDLYGLD